MQNPLLKKLFNGQGYNDRLINAIDFLCDKPSIIKEQQQYIMKWKLTRRPARSKTEVKLLVKSLQNVSDSVFVELAVKRLSLRVQQFGRFLIHLFSKDLALCNKTYMRLKKRFPYKQYKILGGCRVLFIPKADTPRWILDECKLKTIN